MLGLLQERITKQPISEESEIPTRRVALVSSLLDRVRYAQDDGDGGSFAVAKVKLLRSEVFALRK